MAGHYYDTAGYILWDKSNKINNPHFACRQFQWEDQLQTVPACRCVTASASKKLHPKVRNHGEGPY